MGTIYARTTGAESSDVRRTIDGEQWELLRDNVPSLVSAVSGMRTSGVNLQAGSHVQYLHAGRVSAHYFDVLGLHPILGRNFSEDEDRPHGPRTAILSYALWRTVFDANSKMLGQAVLLKGEPYTIIGVLPESATTPLNADLYTALQPSREGEGQAANFLAIMRLRDGATWQQANAEINRAWARSVRTQRFAKNNPGARITYYSVPLQKGETNTLRPQVLALMLAAGFILLIACANLAGLTLVRMSRRTSEIATRLALGASRWQIQRQLWIENLLLAVVGGIAGIAVGFLALRGLLLLLPEHFLPVANVPLDSRVLGFTLLLSLLTSVLFGMLPAMTTRKIDLRSSMASRAVIGAGSVRLRQGLIAGEVALTVVLLAAAGLLIRTLIHLETMPPGFNPTGVISAKASLDDVRYHDPAAFRKLLNESLDRMREIPGISCILARLSLSSFRNAAGSWYRISSRDAFALMTPFGLKPGGMLSRWMSVRMSSPAAASSTTVRATSPVINPCRRRTRPAPITLRLAIEDRRSTFPVVSAGNMPNSTLVSSERDSVKPRTRLSRGTFATGRKCSGRSSNSPRSARKPTPMPAIPPTRASSRFSIQSCL